MISGMNEWTVSGEVVYLKELEGEFAASLKLKGEAKRLESISSQSMEVGCLMSGKLYDEFKKKGGKLYSSATLSGHIETWKRTVRTPDGKLKNKDKLMFIADYIVEVA